MFMSYAEKWSGPAIENGMSSNAFFDASDVSRVHVIHEFVTNIHYKKILCCEIEIARDVTNIFPFLMTTQNSFLQCVSWFISCMIRLEMRIRIINNFSNAKNNFWVMKQLVVWSLRLTTGTRNNCFFSWISRFYHEWWQYFEKCVFQSKEMTLISDQFGNSLYDSWDKVKSQSVCQLKWRDYVRHGFIHINVENFNYFS